MRLCPLRRRVSLRRCAVYVGLVCLLRVFFSTHFWRSDPAQQPVVDAPQRVTSPPAPVPAKPTSDTGYGVNATVLVAATEPENEGASLPLPPITAPTGVRSSNKSGGVPAADVSAMVPLPDLHGMQGPRKLPPRSHFVPDTGSSVPSVAHAKEHPDVPVASQLHHAVQRPAVDGPVSLQSVQPDVNSPPRSRTEPRAVAKGGQKGQAAANHIGKARAAIGILSSHEKSHGGVHHDAHRGVFNWGSGLVEPVQLPSTIWIGFHDHFDGDSEDGHGHAVPFPVDASTIHFRSVTKEATVVAWEAPDPGLYKWDILGYRVQWRKEGRPWPPHDAASGAAVSGGSTEQGGSADVMTSAGSPSTGTDKTEVLVETFASFGLYYFRVRAWNHGGAGAWSEESYGLWPPTPPEPPADLRAVAIPVSGLNVTWSPAGTSGTQSCVDIGARDVAAGICTTVGTGLPIDSYKLEIMRGIPTGTESDHWQGAVRLENMPRGVMPSAPAVPGFVHLMVDPTFKALLPNALYSFRVSAHNGAGWSQPSAVLSVTTLGPPARPGTVSYTEAGRDFLRLVWSAPQVAADGTALSAGNTISTYRVFGSSWNERSKEWEAATRFTLTSDRKRPYAASPLAVPTPRPASLPENEWLEFFFGWEGDSAIANSDGDIHYIADFLSPETLYRFVVSAVSASGESLPSLPSVSMSTLLGAPSKVRMFIGPPCVYLGQSRPTEFLASSAGKGTRYTWQLPDGSPIGRCLSENDNCATMEYTFPAAGPHRKNTGGGNAFEVALLAYNTAGITRLQTHVHVSYCGCLDPFDESYDPYADFMVPSDCSRQQSWQGAPSELPRGSTIPFQVHFDARYIFGVEITLRVDTGQVAMCYSTKKVPDQFGVTPAPLFDHPFQRSHGTWATNIVVHQADGVSALPTPGPTPPMTPVVVPGSEVDGEHCEFGISTYTVLTVPYARLAPTRRQQRENTPPSSIFIGVKGTHIGFTRFEMLARPLSFEGVPRTTLGRDKSAPGPHTTGVVEGHVMTGKWAFYEVPLGRLGLADLEIQLRSTGVSTGSSAGCLSLYTSWNELWPSPLRQTSSTPGYERSIEVGDSCDAVGTGSGSGVVWTTIQPLTDELRRTLSIGITDKQAGAGSPHETGFVFEVIRHDYASYKTPIRLLEGLTAAGSLASSSSAARVLGHGRLDFFELFAAGGFAQVQLTVRVGQISLLCATAGLPTLGRYAKRWTLTPSSSTHPGDSPRSVPQHVVVGVSIARDCGMAANTSDQYFWSEHSISQEDELRQRVSLRGHENGRAWRTNQRLFERARGRGRLQCKHRGQHL